MCVCTEDNGDKDHRRTNEWKGNLQQHTDSVRPFETGEEELRGIHTHTESLQSVTERAKQTRRQSRILVNKLFAMPVYHNNKLG